MPTESPRLNPHTGPPPAGQSPQPGPRLPTHPPPPHYIPNRVPQHNQNPPIPHSHRSHPGAPIPYTSLPAHGRPMPPGVPSVPNQQAAGPPMQQPAGRVSPQFYNGFVNEYMHGHNPYQYIQYPPQFYPVAPAPTPAPQAHPAAQPPQQSMNGRHQRPSYPHQAPPPNHAMQCGPPPPQTFYPRRTRKILSIVDPDSRQEIKPEKPADPSTPSVTVTPTPAVKIAPPAPRPLSLVSDPADSKSSRSKASEKSNGDVAAPSKPTPVTAEASPDVEHGKSEPVKTEPAKAEPANSEPVKSEPVKSEPVKSEPVKPQPVKPQPVKSDHSTTDPVKVEHVKLESVNPDLVEPPTPETVVSEESALSEVPETTVACAQETTVDDRQDSSVSPAVDEPIPTDSKQEDNLDGITSDISSSTFADVRCESSDGPLTATNSDEQPTVAKLPSEPEEPDVPDVSPAETAPTAAPKEEDKSTTSTTSAKMKEIPPVSKDDNPGSKKAEEASAKSVDNTVESKTSTDSRPAPPSMVFKPGERRAYPLTFLREMMQFPSTKKTTHFSSVLSSVDILKGEGTQNNNARRTNSRDNHPMRSGSGSGPSRPFPSMQPFPISNIRGSVPPGVQTKYFDDPRRMPPPVIKSLSSRDGDPRGSRSQGGARGGRYGGPMRSSHTPVDPYVSQTPVVKLKRAENAWSTRKQTEDEITSKVKEVRSLLNKLTLEKFDRIFQKIVDIDITTVEVLTGIVKEIFEKPLYEPKFSGMYAELCRRLDQTLQPVLDKKEVSANLNFRRILLNNCKDEFTRFSSGVRDGGESGKEDVATNKDEPDATASAEKAGKDNTPQEKQDEEMKALMAKRRMLANVRFIGELYLKDLLRETIIHKNCIKRLLTIAKENLEEEVLEAVCKLISKVGGKLSSNVGATDTINYYFQVLLEFTRDSRVPARIRFMIQDLVEQRENNWKVRREEVGAKTIAEIHKDIEEKEKAKQEAANAMRDRKHRHQGSRMDHGRIGSQPRLSMTMAGENRRSSSGMSRTNAMLERGLNRSSTGSLSGASSMRLGPKSSMGQLRPRTSLKNSVSGNLPTVNNSSGSRFSALGSDPDRSSAANTGSDALRPKLSSGGQRPVSQRRSMSRVEPPRPAAPKVELLDPEVIKKKVKSLYEEYLTIESLEEFTICLEEEVKKPNYQAFMESFVKLTMEGKTNAIPKVQKLIASLIGNGTVPAKAFLSAFEKHGPELMNLELDYPLATEIFSGVVIGAVSTKEFKAIEGNGEFGVGFVRKIFDRTAEKNAAAKLVVMICSAIFQREKSNSDEATARKYVRKVYQSLNIDLSAEMNAWDDMMGPRMLNRMLDRANMTFLIPSLSIEQKVKSILEGDPSEDKVFDGLSSDLDMSGEDGVEVVKAVIRVALDVVFSDGTQVESKLEQVLRQCVVGPLVRKCKEGSSIPRSHQMGAVCAVQAYLTRKDAKVPATVAEQATASTIFSVLYGDTVEEETFRLWKDDTGATMEIGGKEKMIVDTSRFFQWLDEAEEE